MPNTNDKTEMTPEQLREHAKRIRDVAEAFEMAATGIETRKQRFLLLSIDNYLSTLKRLESFKRTIEREHANAEIEQIQGKTRKRIVSARKKKGDA